MKACLILKKPQIGYGILIVLLSILTAVSAPTMVRAETPEWKEMLPALRIQVDVHRHRVWVLNFDAVYLYNMPDRRLIKRIVLPNWTVASDVAVCAPDLALTPSGAALVTSNVVPAIWEIDVQKLTARERVISLDTDNDKDVGFTGLAFGRTGRDLFGVSSLHGSAWRINLAKGAAQKIRLSEPIRGACGVAVESQRKAKAGDVTPVLCIAGVGAERRVELNSKMSAGRTDSVPCF